MIHASLYVGQSAAKGRGVFATEDLPARVLVEVSPVIVMSARERILLDQTSLHDYIFEWGEGKDQCCMALGYIPIYNHSYQSNCEYEMDFDLLEIRIRTVVPITAGEELFINYNGNWNDSKPVWFEAK